MADKKPNPSDLYIQDFLRGMQTGQIGSKLPEDSLATTQLESDQIRSLAQDQVTLGQRDLGDYLQDVGTGLMGTFGAIGNTAILGVAAAGDGLERLVTGESDWEATQQALKLMNSTSQYWNSLQSHKSDAFDRITQYRQDRAIEQANAEVQAETGENANWLRRQGAAFSAAAGSYLSNPDQIVTDGIAQLPYMLTGGVAKAATAAVPRAGALLARMVGKGMSVEAAEKAIQMGIVGGLQGTIEGADAASSAYDRVMRSTDTFGPEEQAARESAALEAAAKAFGIAGITSAVTGTLASKFELHPFGAIGKNALTRSGDNLIKALEEGVQETIESGTSQFAANYGGNTVLRGKDRVALDEGVGGAAGQGLVVGAGSTVITNPRSGVDAVVAPLTLAGQGFSYVANRAVRAEHAENMAAAKATADNIVATATTPALQAAMNQGVQQKAQTTDTPAEEVVLPAEIDTSSQIGLFATGMEYLRGKNMDSKDAVGAFHVLGSVLAAANNIQRMRDAAAQDVANQSLTPEARKQAQDNLTAFNGLMDSNLLDKWVADYPMEDIENDLESLRQNPEAFGSVIAHLAERNPLRMTPKLIETALEAKSLPKPQRDALLLAQELKAAADDLKVTGKPDSAEVKRSMMQTGFPGYRENDSVAGYVSRVTTALAENDQATAQTEFHRLVKFANFEQGRAAAYEAAKDQMAKDPDSKRIELNGYYQLNEYGKLDKTKPQFVDKKALGLVKTVRSDADAIQKMVTLLAKRTGLKAVEAAPTEAPVAVSKPAPTKTVTESKPKVEKPAAKPQAAPAAVEEDTELSAMSDEAIGQEMEQLAKAISRRRNNDTGKAVEQDARYNALVYEIARRMQQGSTKPTTPKPVDKPVDKPVVKKAEPAAADAVAEVKKEARNSENPFKDSVVQGLVYHATRNAADLENIQMVRTNEGNQWLRGGFGKGFNNKKVGFYTTRNLGYAAAVAGATIPLGVDVTTVEAFENNVSEKNGVQLIPFYVNLRNPYLVKDNDTIEITSISEKEMADLQAQGYDGLMLEDPAFRYEEIVVFDASQLQRAALNKASEKSKNHYTDLQPSYPVAEGATVAEQNDAKNHLSQSFTTSDRPGLVSKLPKTADQMIESLGVSKEAADLIKGVFELKNKLIGRLNEGIAALYPKNMLDAMLKGQNEWKKESSHSLYATRWDAESISFDPVIAEVMAWTAIQHSLDLVQPVKWSSEKEAQFVATYGEQILPLLAEGWVPLSEQVHQTARKLQNNLELTPNNDGNSASQEYTEGTMLALAMDSLSTIMGEGRLLGSQQIKQLDGPLVQWVRLQAHEDTWHDVARALENFFPERSSAVAGIVAKKPTEVNTLYRGSRQEIGKEQRKALLNMSQTSHKLSPLVHSLWKSLPEDVVERLFGYKPVNKKPTTIAEKARDGANRTLKSDIKTIKAHVQAVMEFAAANGVEITDAESFFEYEMAVNGRAMTKGTSPQSSKLYREIFSTVQREIDPTKNNRKFLLAAAQGLGIKMDKQNLDKSLDDLYALWGKPEVRAAIDAMGRLVHNDLLQMEADITAIEQSGIELTPHAITALAHLAEYEKGDKFISSLSYEIDGLTDGPINLMMLMGLRGSAEQMEHWLGLGGLWFSETPVVVQDKIDQLKEWFTEKNGDKAKDLYEIIANKSSQINNEQARKILASVKPNQRDSAQGLMRAILHLMHITELAESDLHALTAKHKRSFTKKPTQAAGYQQGMKSIINDLIDTMLESLSERIDAVDENGKPVMTDMDWRAVDALFGRRLGYSKENKQYYVSAKPIKEGWAGEPLTKAERKALRNTLFSYGGIGLADATMTTIGFQRNHMEAAVSLVNARIQYAQATLRRLYKEKQDAEVAAGRLHPNQALSRKDENALIKQVWALVPHPMLRNTGGLPSASMSRNGVPLNDVRRVQGSLFNRQNLQVSEAGFEDPGVAFAALSIMASGDGSMMAGFHANHNFNALNMFDGTYIDPEDMDEVSDAINGEVKKNWEHDFIGAVLESVDMNDSEFQAWAENQNVMINEAGNEVSNLWQDLKDAQKMLETQRQQQIQITKEINSRTHFVSHMAGTNGPHKREGKPLNSTTLGTSTTDPLLDLAADELGTVINGIRKLSATEIKKLLQEHTFENPVLSGLWKVLAPLLSDDLTLYMSSDKQGMAEFYQQNELQEMGTQTNGVSVGNRVYVRTINAETIVHELLHATTKNLTAIFFSKPAALTAQQRTAMKNLLALQDQFMAIDPSTLSPLQQAMVEHTQSIIRNLDPNSALQEFLAYGLSNYHLQRTLGNTKSVLGSLVESVFNAIKALFGFPNGTQSDSMLAQMFSNFEALTEQATNVAYPISVENALESVNLDLARSFGSVLNRLVYADALQAVTGETQGQAGTATTQLAARSKARTRLASIKDLARTRMQELADTNLFPTMTDEQQAAGEYLQALFAASLQLKATDNALLVRVVDAVRDAGPKAWRTNGDPHDQTDIDLAQARYDFFFRGATSDHDQAADILAMSQVNPEFAAYLNKIILPQQDIQKGSLNNWLDSSAKFLYDKMDTGLALRKGATLDDALDVATLRIQKSLQASAKRNEAKSNAYRNFTNKLSQGVQYIGEMAGKTAEARLKLKSNKDWITSGLTILAGTANDSYADMLGNLTLSLTNHLSAKNPVADLIQEMVGTTSDNYRLIQLKGLAARMVSAIRQTFREQVPVAVKSWFKDLSPEQDELLHTVIGKAAVYSLSKDLKNRMEELLTDPTNAKLDAERLLLNGGDRTKRLLMIKYAKHLGDRMANRGNQALYMNTRAIAGLAIHGGGEKLSTAEYAALENLSTLQALSHLTPLQRRQMLNLYRENTEGFWKTAALINAFHDFDTQRAGSNTATLNFQKGYIPVESDSRKKVKLFQKSEVRKAERMGWVQVGEFADNPNMIYMATTVGKTPTLSGGAIHAVDMHMNGIHFHTGMPTDPSIQTVISHPKAVADIRARILSGENMPYTVLYDAAGDVEGFQRVLDPAIVERHTKTVGRISDAAGIWLGRLHEERVAHGQNQAAADLLRKTWDQGKADKREHEFVNIRQTLDPKDPNAKRDKVIQNVWETLPYHTKIQLETAFADGSSNPPIWVRRDQLHDAIGYHKASVGNFFTGDNRYNSATNTNVAALARQFLGKNAYKYLVMGEEGWQAVVGSAKDTIIVKSLVVALNNLGSNQIQLFMITGNPVWNLRVQSQKHKELVSYLGYQQRNARLTAELLATNDPNALAKIAAEQKFLQGEMRKLSIWPLIDSGELPTIAEGLSETEEFSMVGDLTDWIEKQVGKLPPAAMTVLNNLVVSKETSLYKGLDRAMQYGDFVAKATMYEWLTTKDANAKKEALALMAKDSSKKLTYADALHTAALMEVNDEFVNYTRLPGRWRTYGEDMGLMWFYNYKIRILKIAFRRIRKNPAAFLIGAGVGNALGLATLMDSLPWNTNFSYSIGVDPLLSAHETIIWNQML